MQISANKLWIDLYAYIPVNIQFGLTQIKMIRMLLICLSIASFSVLHICSLTKDASKATFELYSGESHGTMTRLFDKIFHQCSLEDDCNFVAKNTNTNSFKKYSHEANLPKDRKTLIIFKKLLMNFEKKKSGKYS